MRGPRQLCQDYSTLARAHSACRRDEDIWRKSRVVGTFVMTAVASVLALGLQWRDRTKRDHVSRLRGRLGRDLDLKFT